MHLDDMHLDYHIPNVAGLRVLHELPNYLEKPHVRYTEPDNSTNRWATPLCG